jgi:hypothetical protein
MAINPNIALSVQPIQQPNLLGQAGQMMALKAAQQETEGYEGVRSALSGGMSATDPRILQYGKRGIETFRAAGEGQTKQIEIAKKQNEILGGIFGGVLQDPSTGPQAVARLVQMGVMTSEQAQRVIEQAGNNPDAWRQLAKPYYEGAISAEKRLTDLTTRRGQDVSAGTTMRGQDMTDRRLREQQEFERNRRSVIAGEGEFLQTDPYGNVYRVEGFGPMRGPNAAAPAMPPAATNALITTQPSVNALAPTAAPQGAGPTVAAAAAMDAQNNVPRPRQPFTTPVPVIDKDGNTVLMQGREAVATGATPATPATEKRQAQIRTLPATISQAKDALNLINRMVGTPDGKSKPHKGFEGAVGAGMGMRFIPGTSARDFQAMHEQITGGAFMQAFETLKGGGQITEKEGEKATAAITRMSLATSEKEYMVAAREFQEVIRRGIETAEKDLRAGPGGGGGGASADPLGIR